MKVSVVGTRRLIAVLAAVPAALLLTGMSLAQPDRPRGPREGHGPHGGGEPMFERMIERLDLTPAQRDTIRDLFEKHRDAAGPQHEEMQAARRALGERIQAETFDEAAIRTAAAKVAKIEADLAVQRGLVVSQVRQVLTPEQRAEARRMHEERREQREEFAPRRGRRPGGPPRGDERPGE